MLLFVTTAEDFTTILFWSNVTNGGGLPTGDLLKQLKAILGFDEFKAKFSKARATQFGSGWAWLCVQRRKTRRLWNSKSR
jgi:superoxide dismutase